MSRFYSHLNTAANIIREYDGKIPLSAFLKQFFAKEKKYGSRDRKVISSLCYNYYRLGKSVNTENLQERLIAGILLSTTEMTDLLTSERSLWSDKIALPLTDKLSFLDIKELSIFPYNDELSNEVDVNRFNISFLIQPKLFVRIRPGKQESVKSKLAASNISFEEVGPSCLVFENGTKLEQVLIINSEIVIQDLNSQRVGEFLLLAKTGYHPQVWDCCAASGGKSIMAVDTLGDIKLTVSDVRESIIHNLHARFKEAGIKKYSSFVADVTYSEALKATLNNATFDLVICDAPCSGSGTWSRTPEQLLFFKREDIERYSQLQKNIVSNTIPFIKKDGYFLYVTCSVFKKENEEVVDFIKNNFELNLVEMKLLKGYDRQADSMFVAVFENVSTNFSK